jgi:hypothetical protein
VIVTVVEKDGTYRLPPVRAGEYVILAAPVEELPSGIWQADMRLLERLARRGERITLAEHEQRTLDLRRVASR